MSKFRIIALLIFFLGGSLFADTIILRNGQTIEGKIENQTANDIFIRTPQGLRRVPKIQITRITYEEALKKQQELKQKLLLEQQKKEEAEKLEEQLKQEQLKQEQLKQEQLKQEQLKKEPPYRRHDLSVFGGLGVQKFSSGLIGSWMSVNRTMRLFQSGFSLDEEPISKLGPLWYGGVGYTWNRFSIELQAAASLNQIATHATVNSKQYQASPTPGLQVKYWNADSLYKPIKFTSVDATFKYLVFHSKLFDIHALAGGRSQENRIKGKIQNSGFQDDSKMPLYSLTDFDAHDNLKGGTAGLEIIQSIALTDERISRISVKLGYYSGRGHLTGHEKKFNLDLYGLNGEPEFGFDSKIVAQGPFGSIRFDYPLSNRISIGCGFGYQITNYKMTTLVVKMDSPGSDPVMSYITMQLQTAMLVGFSQVKEIHKTFDVRTTYRFDL